MNNSKSRLNHQIQYERGAKLRAHGSKKRHSSTNLCSPHLAVLIRNAPCHGEVLLRTPARCRVHTARALSATYRPTRWCTSRTCARRSERASVTLVSSVRSLIIQEQGCISGDAHATQTARKERIAKRFWIPPMLAASNVLSLSSFTATGAPLYVIEVTFPK